MAARGGADFLRIARPVISSHSPLPRHLAQIRIIVVPAPHIRNLRRELLRTDRRDHALQPLFERSDALLVRDAASCFCRYSGNRLDLGHHMSWEEGVSPTVSPPSEEFFFRHGRDQNFKSYSQKTKSFFLRCLCIGSRLPESV